MQYLIVGAKFRPPARALLDTLPTGTKLVARREPHNQYDPNAIQVILPKGFTTNDAMKVACEQFGFPFEEVLAASFWHLGYIPREHAITIAPLMDSAKRPELDGTLTFSPQGFPCFRLKYSLERGEKL